MKAELVLGLPSSVPGDLVPPALCLVTRFPFRVTGKLSVLNLMVGWEFLAQMSNSFKTFICWVSVGGWVGVGEWVGLGIGSMGGWVDMGCVGSVGG